MTSDEICEAIEQVKDKIYELKQQIEDTPNMQEKLKLQRQLKEMQYLQLWHLDLLERGS